MKITRENINITHFLVGFHSFNKDHNYPKFKGDLINDFSQKLNITLNTLSIGNETIIKTSDRNSDIFEIKITPNALIYQDTLTLEEFLANSQKFLELWKNYSSQINLRLVGLVRNFEFNVSPFDDLKKLHITDSFFKGNQIWDKINSGNFTFRFNQILEEINYNIQITLSENRDNIYELKGIVDFNQIAADKDHSLQDMDIKRIFERSKKYFENELLDFLT